MYESGACSLQTENFGGRRHLLASWESLHGTTGGLKSRKKTEIAQRRNFVTDQLNDVENTYDHHLLMVVAALWTQSAGYLYNTGEVFLLKRVPQVQRFNVVLLCILLCVSLLLTTLYSRVETALTKRD